MDWMFSFLSVVLHLSHVETLSVFPQNTGCYLVVHPGKVVSNTLMQLMAEYFRNYSQH